MLFRSTRPDPGEWQDVLAKDYLEPQYHIGFWRAMGRRLRRNYMWIFSFQAVAYAGKIVIHPTPVTTMDELLTRMAVGPFPGVFILALGVVFHGSWLALAIRTHILDHHKHGRTGSVGGMG